MFAGPIGVRLDRSSAAGRSGWSREIGGFELGWNGAVIGGPAFGIPREGVGFLIYHALIVFTGFRIAKLERLTSSAIGWAIAIVVRRFLHPFRLVRLDSKVVLGLFAFVSAMGLKAVPAFGRFGGRSGTVMEDRISALCVDAIPQVIVDVIALSAFSEHQNVFPMEGSCGASLAEDRVLLALLLEVVELFVERQMWEYPVLWKY